MDYTLWEEVGDQLVENYDRQYITPEEYLEPNNPISAFVVTPTIDEFFGTKVLNFCIVNHPFGWRKNGDGELEDHWDDDIQSQVDDAIAKHKDSYNGFAQYKTIVYIDMYYATKQEEQDPESRAREMLTAVGGHMQDICNELADYGWEYGGTIDSAPEWTFFQPRIDEFYGINQS